MTDWQPIETAPKVRDDPKWSGPRLHLWCPRRGARYGRWDPCSFAKKARPYWSTEGTHYVTEDRGDQPTHWQPEPEPPND